MNKIYKVVWSKVKNTYVVVSEVAKANGKSGVRSIAAAAAVAVMLSGGTALAADYDHDGRLFMDQFSSGVYDNITVTNDNSTAVVSKGHGEQLTAGNSIVISSVNGGISTETVGSHLTVSAPTVSIEDVGYLSGIHVDREDATVSVKDFDSFSIDATADGKWGFPEGNGIRVNRDGALVEAIGNAGSSIKIDGGQSGIVLTSNGDINLSASTIEITTLGHDGKPYKGQAIASTGNGTVDVLATDKIVITNHNVKNADVYAVYSSNGNINVSTNGTTEVTGDIKAEGNGEVNLLLNNAESFLTGAVTTADNGKTALAMNNGATWNVTGDSTITGLGGTDGVIQKAETAADDVSVTVNNGKSDKTNTVIKDSTLELKGVDLVVNSDYNKAAYSGGVIQNTTINSDSSVVINQTGKDNAIGNGQNTIKADSIELNAANGSGIYAQESADCVTTLEAKTIKITANMDNNGYSANGIYASSGGSVTVTGFETLDVTVNNNSDIAGEGGPAINANTNGTINIDGGSVTAMSEGRSAVLANGGKLTMTVDSLDASTANLEGGSATRKNSVIGADGANASLNITVNDSLTVSGDGSETRAIGATGGSTVNIDGTADMTINGAVQAESTSDSTISLKGNDITITAKAKTASETEGAVRNASIDATGKVTIEADGLCGVGAGPDKTTMAQSVNSIKAKEIDITSTNAFGVYANNHSYHAVGTRVHSYLEAETIDITSKKDGIYASNGAVTEVVGFDTLNVTSEEQGIGSEFGVMTFTGGDMTVTSAEEGIRSKLGGDLVFDVDSLKVDAGLESIKLTGKSIMDVEAQKVQLDGDITLEDNNYGSPELNITFNGDESYLNGNVTTSEGGVTDMTFNGGATWTTEGSADSNVTNLTMDGGIINQESSGEITIDNLTGEGNVVFAEGSGQVNVLAAEAGAKLNLTMAGVDADSFNTTEDLNGLANLIDVAEDATANVTGNVHVDEGLLNGAIDMTVDYENVDGDELLNGVIKDVRQGTSTTVEATSGVATNAAVAWREEDATFSQRLGELRSSKEGQGVWARFVQGEFERGNNFETEYNMFQIGYDKAKGDWHYGLAVNHTEGDTTYAAGSGELSNTSLSAYGTWLGERGHYKDIVAKVGSISSDYSIDAAGQLTKGEYDTYGTSLSAEYGMKNDMGKGWFVTPLAKMTYMHIGGDSYTTNNGINVKHDAIDSLVARLGVELGKELGNKGAVYVKASALHDFCGDADTTLRLGGNSALLTDEIGGTWYEVGFGFNYKMSDATNLYADVIKTYGDEIRTPWQWNAGVRYSF